ncbi:hypothetical protein [Actinokineospora iranica]|uniref:DUF4878 domain-containing protein n=1 Tax=Actinokineospora iranica TaxID=1271860 RepID=A0A1G6IXE4_9PSEU|nr:hypothetical protein [Actinokineospora iranica]SDC11090.1 hypothetical protein SAMN05216174_101139 [Actinokineospora iranica]
MTVRFPHSLRRAPLAVAALLLAVTAAACSSAGSPPPPERGSAEDQAALRQAVDGAVDAINQRNPTRMKSVSCDPSRIGDRVPEDGLAELERIPEITGDQVVVQLRLTTGGETATVPLRVERRESRWCVS